MEKQGKTKVAGENAVDIDGSIKRSLYADYLLDISVSKNYAFTEKHLDFLKKPGYTIRNAKEVVTSLTYRKINDWDNKDLISGSRDNKEAGWRKFSIRDIVKLQIIEGLRKLGVSIAQIKKMLHKLDTQHAGTEKFLELEYHIFACMFKQKVLLIIDGFENIFLLPEEQAIRLNLLAKLKATSLVVLPFYAYVQTIKNNLVFDESNTLRSIWKSEKEQKIIDIIESEDYEEIKITKKNGAEFLIRAKSTKRGKFSENDVLELLKAGDYQKVSVSKTGGSFVTLEKEETIKI